MEGYRLSMLQLCNNYVVDVEGEEYNGHDAAHVKGITDHRTAGLKCADISSINGTLQQDSGGVDAS